MCYFCQVFPGKRLASCLPSPVWKTRKMLLVHRPAGESDCSNHTWMSTILWFQDISIPPPQKGFAVWPPSPLDFPKLTPKMYPPSPPEFSKFSHTPSNCCYISYWSEQISSFVHWDANFVSFVYFLLNSITDKRIPDANSLCALVMNKFCEFHVFSVEFYNRQVNSLCA